MSSATRPSPTTVAASSRRLFFSSATAPTRSKITGKADEKRACGRGRGVGGGVGRAGAGAGGGGERLMNVKAAAGVLQETIASTAVASATIQEVEAAEVVVPYHYTPSPMDTSLLVPQLVGLFFLALCVAYVQLVLNPTARVKFNSTDEAKRAMIKELFASEGREGDDRGLERWLYRLWLKPMARPRGDQTKGGTVIPGLEGSAAAEKARVRAAGGGGAGGSQGPQNVQRGRGGGGGGRGEPPPPPPGDGKERG